MFKFDFYGASSLKMQQSWGRHVVPLSHIKDQTKFSGEKWV
jgi:hypothetical protein